MLMLIPMRMMRALTLMFLLDAFNVVANVVAEDAHAETKMPNDARHLACGNSMMFMPRFFRCECIICM